MSNLNYNHYIEYKEKYNQRTGPTRNNLNTILDNQERVYLPFDCEDVSGSDSYRPIQEYLNNLGYTIVDYKKGLASKLPKDHEIVYGVRQQTRNNTIRIGKLLNDKPEMLKRFSEDPFRNNSKNDKGDEYQIVISQKYEDILTMSTNRPWSSCMNIGGGRYRSRVKGDLKNGTLVAYLIKKDDMEIEKPLGRVLIKPYGSKSKRGKTIYGIDMTTYGNVPNPTNFRKTIMDYIYSKFPITTIGWYSLKQGLYKNNREAILFVDEDHNFYLDGFDNEGYNLAGFDKNGYNREGYNPYGWDRYSFNKDGILIQYGQCTNIKKTDKEYPFSDQLTIEQVGFLLGSCGLKQKNIMVDDKGYVNIDRDLYILTSLTELPVKFGKVKGNFTCNGIRSLVNFPYDVSGDLCITTTVNTNRGSSEIGGILPRQEDGKQFRVGGSFILSTSKLKNLKGFPEWVGGNYNVSYTGLQSLEGIATFIGGDLACKNNNLTNLKPLTNTTLKGTLLIANNGITSLEGVPQTLSKLSCEYNQLKNFKGIGNVHTILAYNNQINSLLDLKDSNVNFLRVDNNKIKDLVGLPKTLSHLIIHDNLIEDFKEFNPEITTMGELSFNSNPIKSLRGLENVKRIESFNFYTKDKKEDFKLDISILSNCEFRTMDVGMSIFNIFFETLTPLPKMKTLRVIDYTFSVIDQMMKFHNEKNVSIEQIRGIIKNVENINHFSNETVLSRLSGGVILGSQQYCGRVRYPSTVSTF